MRKVVAMVAVCLGKPAAVGCVALLATCGRASAQHAVPWFPAADAAQRQGFVRVINHAARAGEAQIVAYDDGGNRRGPIRLALPAGETVHFNASDLRDGSADKGLSAGVGAPSAGDWRLEVTSSLDIEVLAYLRTRDGFLTSMHDVAPADAEGIKIAFFNPASNRRQVSRLRLINPTTAPAAVEISGVDDRGRASDVVRVSVPARAARTFTAQELEGVETSAAVQGSLGDGEGKWRLAVVADQELQAMSLLASPTGHVTNLSTAPAAAASARRVALFPAAANTAETTPFRQGFLRLVNRAASAGVVTIAAFDQSPRDHEPIALRVPAGETVHVNSDDLEHGNAAKGLSAGSGDGVGDWRLELRLAANMAAYAYIRTRDGFVTSLHDVAAVAGGNHRVAVFNPAGNVNQASVLRIANPGDTAAHVAIFGVDDRGAEGGEVRLTIPAGGTRTLYAADLEAGVGVAGALGDGTGKWQLAVQSSSAIDVQSLIENRTGHLTNLSTATRPAATAVLPGRPLPLQLIDALPAPGVDVDPTTRHLRVAHLDHAASTFGYAGSCNPSGAAIRRRLTDLSVGAPVDAVDHHLSCDLVAAARQQVHVDALGADGGYRQGELSFATGSDQGGLSLMVRDSLFVSRAQVEELFGIYIVAALLNEIEDAALQFLAGVLIDRLARNTWAELRDPKPRHGVLTQRVAYASRDPWGRRSTMLTGLVAAPALADASSFEPRDRVLVLSHATGSTPSRMEFSDAWYVLAIMFASRGYLVVAPDNWGRGELRDATLPETYLLAHRTANNSLDMVHTVLASDDYAVFHGASRGWARSRRREAPALGRLHGAGAAQTDLALIGYSQGGHTAMALWLAIAAQGQGLRVRELHSGGAPHNLYQTFRGALQLLANRCAGGAYCRLVDRRVILPYALGRIVPAALAYIPGNLTRAELVQGDALHPDFIAGMLTDEARFDGLKTTLQRSSFTNLVDPASVIAADTAIHLYHSPFDRLVPQQNSRELAALLAADFNVTFHDGECSSEGFEALFGLVTIAGPLHAVCGMEVLDEVLKAYR